MSFNKYINGPKKIDGEYIQFHHIFDELAFFREIDINYKWHNQFKKGSLK